MMKRRTLLLAATSLPAVAFADVANLSDAINKAGRQRMLSQRMAKAWLAMSMQIDTGNVLEQSIALFDRQLHELKTFASTSELRNTYQDLSHMWGDYKSHLTIAAPDRTKAGHMLETANKVLSLAHKGTGQFEALATRPAGKLVNVAGRQRMLSQRMAMYYFLATVPTQPDQAKAEIRTARDEFVTAMKLLKAAPEATSKIRDEIALAESQWVFFNQSLANLDNINAGIPRGRSEVFFTSETILATMDRITGLYAAQTS